MPKSPNLGKKAQNGLKSRKMAKKAVFPVFGGFQAPWGLPGGPGSGGFTSTPRAGAPRYPGGRGWENAPPRRGVNPRRGCRGSPPGA